MEELPKIKIPFLGILISFGPFSSVPVENFGGIKNFF